MLLIFYCQCRRLLLNGTSISIKNRIYPRYEVIMNKACILLIGSFILASDVHTIMPGAQKGSVNNFTASAQLTNNERGPYPVSSYKYPEFYRGLYLTVASANNFAKLKYFVEKAKSSNINTLVLDVQS